MNLSLANDECALILRNNKSAPDNKNQAGGIFKLDFDNHKLKPSARKKVDLILDLFTQGLSQAFIYVMLEILKKPVHKNPVKVLYNRFNIIIQAGSFKLK